MTAIKAHFDGKVFVPDEPVELPLDTPVTVQAPSALPAHNHAQTTPEPCKPDESVFAWLARHAVRDADLPSDLAAEHDHYLYGTPKRDDQG
jgi:hypothetical protein